MNHSVEFQSLKLHSYLPTQSPLSAVILTKVIQFNMRTIGNLRSPTEYTVNTSYSLEDVLPTSSYMSFYSLGNQSPFYRSNISLGTLPVNRLKSFTQYPVCIKSLLPRDKCFIAFGLANMINMTSLPVKSSRCYETGKFTFPSLVQNHTHINSFRMDKSIIF